jgi:two-component system, OmpR family, phosphate regulon sensor histidine kinase PhoR
MPTETVDPHWPKVLSLAVHEFRTPITVVAGYLRMLLKDRAGPVTDQQRRMLEEAEKSCTRLSALLSEVSELSALEGGTATFNRNDVNIREVLTQSVDALPPLPDRDIKVELQTGNGAVSLHGDASRLRTALTSVIAALRRELISSDRLILHEHVRPFHGRNVSWIAISDAARIPALSTAETAALTTFDEWRGGVGLSLAVARRIIHAHGAQIWSPKEETKAGAVIAIPVS